MENSQYEKDLAAIRTMMERSVKFLSLSGLSGILAGFYAITGSTAVYFLADYPTDFPPSALEQSTIIKIGLIALIVLTLSLATGCFLSLRKAKKLGLSIWNAASKQLFNDLKIPLFSGGVLILILIAQGYFGLVAPVSLLFYGLALIQGARSTFEEVKYLGFIEIILGLACALFPAFGLFFWAAGFGVMHIIYGVIMYFRYEQ